jgi:hypothetical protein
MREVDAAGRLVRPESAHHHQDTLTLTSPAFALPV